MPSMIRNLLRGGGGDEARGVVPHTIGNALVLHDEQGVSPEAQSLALSIVEDSDNDVVVLDLVDGMPIASWESMAGLLHRRKRGIRLMTCGENHKAAAMAGQWLSERLNRPVVAPTGELVRGAGGGLFAGTTPGSGWVRFRPGRAPVWEAKRYPAPVWDRAAIDTRASSSTAEIEPLPGGVWIHDFRDPELVAEHRWRLVDDLPCQSDVMTVLLGCPGTPPLSLDDVVRFWRELDDDTRARARFVQYGDVRLPEGEAFGQALADLLGTAVACYTGVPVGAPRKYEIRTVRADGVLGWPPFALELGYIPRVHPQSKARRPSVLSHRAPLTWGEEVSPRVYWYAPDAVVEVVQSGLWLRPAEEPANGERVRATTLDPEGNTLIFDDSVVEWTPRMRELAEDLAAQVDAAMGDQTALFPASVMVPGQAPVGRAEAILHGIEDAEAPLVLPSAYQAPPPAVEPPTAHRSFAAAIESMTDEFPTIALPTAKRAAAIEPARSMRLPEGDEVRAFAAAPTAVPEVEAELPVAWPPPSAEEPPSAVKPPVAFEPPPPTEEPAPAVEPPTMAFQGVEVPVAAPGEQAQQSVAPVEPVEIAAPAVNPAAEVPTGRPATEPEPVTKPPVGLQIAPPAAATALLPKRGLDEERSWLRRKLSREFDTMSSSVSRIMSEHPGLQASTTSAKDDILADSVAVRLYLSPRGAGVDLGLRSGQGGSHVPLARCAVSGLSRLPSFRGTTVFRTSPGEQEWRHYRGRKLVTDWTFVNVLTGPCSTQEGDTDVLVWSMTARRTALLEPEGESRVEDRVLFLPGTHFKILELNEPSAGERGSILMRELGAEEVGADGRVAGDRAPLDELAVNALRRSLERWASAEPKQRIGEASARRFGTLPGLDTQEENDR